MTNVDWSSTRQEDPLDTVVPTLDFAETHDLEPWENSNVEEEPGDPPKAKNSSLSIDLPIDALENERFASNDALPEELPLVSNVSYFSRYNEYSILMDYHCH